MTALLRLAAVLLVGAPSWYAQAEPVTVLESRWNRVQQKAKAGEPVSTGPAPALIPENKNFQRNARENLPKGALDPNERTVDGRSAALEKITQEARAPKTDDKVLYFYSMKMKNESDRKIDVVFWEYRFTEIAAPANVVRRQFLCGAPVKARDQVELFAVSALAPSDVISAASLARGTEKLFDEKVLINRVEYSDGAILQRHDWKYDDVGPAVKRATSTPWGKEVCRVL
jgi:hypothetical protein